MQYQQQYSAGGYVEQVAYGNGYGGQQYVAVESAPQGGGYYAQQADPNPAPPLYVESPQQMQQGQQVYYNSYPSQTYEVPMDSYPAQQYQERYQEYQPQAMQPAPQPMQPAPQQAPATPPQQTYQAPQPQPLPMPQTATTTLKYTENGGRGKLIREGRTSCCGLITQSLPYYQKDADDDLARKQAAADKQRAGAQNQAQTAIQQPQPQVMAPPPPPTNGGYYEEGSSGEAL